MRVCFILPGFCADRCDWHIPALTGFIKEIARNRSPVIYTLDYPYRSSTYSLHGATVHCLSNGKQSGAHRFFRWCELRHRIVQDHLREPFDVVHAFGTAEACFLATQIATTLDVPSVVSLSADEPATQRARFSEPFRLLRRAMWGSAFKRASAVTSASSWRSRRMRRCVQSKLATIPFGVDTSLFLRGQLRSGTQLLAASSLSRSNDYPTLLRAVAIAREELPEITLDIAGMCYQRELRRLMQLITRFDLALSVRFLGPLPFGAMPAAYHDHDLLLHSPSFELEGMAVLEALATGLPVVASDVGISASLPDDLVCRFRSGDAEGMANAIVRSLSSSEHARRALAAGPRFIREYFSVERAAEHFIELYETLQPVSLDTFYLLPNVVPQRLRIAFQTSSIAPSITTSASPSSDTFVTR